MADNTTINAGSGGDTIATDDIAGVKWQRVKVGHGADGAAVDASSANPLPVTDGSIAADGAASQPSVAVQVGGWDGTNFQALAVDNAGRPNVNVNGAVPITDNGGSVTVDGTVTATGPLTDTQLRATAVPVSGTVTASGPLTDAQLRATTVPVADSQVIADNAGFTDGTSKVFPVGLIFDEVAGTALTENDIGAARMDAKRAAVGVIEDATTRGQRAAVSAAGALKVDNSGVTQPVSGTVTANLGTAAVTNAGTFAVQIAANSSVNNAQVSGTATSVNSGVKDAGTQRVILASDQTVVPVSDNAGSLTVDAPVGTPAFVRLSDGAAAITTLPTSLATLPALTTGSAVIGSAGLAPQTSGGLSIFHLVSAATTNATNVKASAGQLFGWYIYNSNAAARKVAFHNSAGTPTAGASVSFSVVIPPTSAANVEFTNGLAFATGIAITTVTDLTDAGTTAVAASDLIINLFYK